jgi:hypothetical protein
MSVKVVFRCQYCERLPDPLTQRCMETQLQEFLFGQYLDAAPERWLIWQGRGIFGPVRYACPEHRGELKAYLREHYGTLGWHPWAIGPHPLYATGPGAATATQRHRASGSSTFGLPGG